MKPPRPPAALLALVLVSCHGGHRSPETAASDAGGPPALSSERFQADVRPVLDQHGCTAGTCHGTFKGGGLYLTNSPDDFASVAAVVVPGNPDQSLLLQKALARVPHVGGRNLADDECDTRRLRAWIGGEPSPACPKRAVRRPLERFVREVAPALHTLGCARATCHVGGGSRLDLGHLDDAPADAKTSLDATGLGQVVVWRNAVVAAALGDTPPHAPPADPTSCAVRRLYAYAAGSDEERCTATPATLDRVVLTDTLLPMLGRRGCFDGSCHGGGAGGLSLFEPRDARTRLNDFLMLTARVETGVAPGETTLLRKTRNDEPHGGGKRLGGEGDCLDGAVVAWIRSAPLLPCTPRAPPPYDRFVGEIQGVLDRMTCSQAICHGGGVKHGYKLVERATSPADLRANYEQTVAQIDLEYMPFSQVMLRMREPCAYAVTGAWIEGTKKPDCPLVDPDPRLFPRVAGQPTHPKDSLELPQ